MGGRRDKARLLKTEKDQPICADGMLVGGGDDGTKRGTLWGQWPGKARGQDGTYRA